MCLRETDTSIKRGTKHVCHRACDQTEKTAETYKVCKRGSCTVVKVSSAVSRKREQPQRPAAVTSELTRRKKRKSQQSATHALVYLHEQARSHKHMISVRNDKSVWKEVEG